MDTLLQQERRNEQIKLDEGFNPCFNGYTTSTICSHFVESQEECFNPCFNGYTTSTKNIHYSPPDLIESFNPCFNGYTTSTI